MTNKTRINDKSLKWSEEPCLKSLRGGGGDDFSVSDTGGSEKKDRYSLGVETMTLGLYFHTLARRCLKRK